MKRSHVAIVFAALLAVASAAQAQFGKLGDILGGRNQDNNAGATAVLVTSFVESNTLVLGAQIKFAEAFGLQDQVALLQAEQLSLSSGATDTAAMKKAKSVSANAQAAIDERMAQQPELTAESRTAYTEGLVSYALAVVAARAVVKNANEAGSSLLSNPLQAAGAGAGAALYVVKEAPGYLQRLVQTGKLVFEYGQRNKIDTPSGGDLLFDAG